MPNIAKGSACCGCSACQNICSHSAISMQPDMLGFVYPVVDAAKCINCGLCEKVCAFHKDYSKTPNLESPDIYAVRHKQMREIELSRSGGMFAAISDHMFTRGGVVYGAGYSDGFRVIHKRASTKAERDEFRGSKYVQSDMNTVFAQVKDDLMQGRHVLFSGTPCQTSGLRAVLTLSKTDTSQLFLCDIVCHGVPSPFVWRDYLKYIEKKENGRISGVNFRDKSRLGWSSHKESYKLENGNTSTYDTFTYLFYQHIMLRPSCGVCHFTNLQRPSDITLADFWGWQQVDSQFNADNKGVSLVLVNTEKGRRFFDEIEPEIHYIKTDAEHCMQPNLQAPSQLSPDSGSFARDYAKHGFNYVVWKYGNIGPYYLLRRILGVGKRYLRKITRR